MLASVYIAIYLKIARKIQIATATAESIPKDSKHPKNQYF
jgi:hypothetical protein